MNPRRYEYSNEAWTVFFFFSLLMNIDDPRTLVVSGGGGGGGAPCGSVGRSDPAAAPA